MFLNLLLTTMLSQYPGEKAHDVTDHPELPAKVRMELWFGLAEEQAAWSARARSEGSFSLYAETVSRSVVVKVW